MARKELFEYSACEIALLVWPIDPNWVFSRLDVQYIPDSHRATDLQ